MLSIGIAEEAFRAQWIVEGWDIDGFPEPAPEREAAAKACRPRWPRYFVQLHRDRLRLAVGERKAA